MLLLGEGGESKLGTNVNYLIEEYGVSVNSDCVVRTVMPLRFSDQRRSLP